MSGGVLRIMDTSTAMPWTILSNTSTPNNFTHNAWPNATGTLCVTTDEQTGGVIKMFDITNKSNPIGLGQFTPNSSAIPHNAFIVGDKVHVSWYTEGYRCIDISDPNNPVEVASYDTWPGSSGGFNGCWGCYPFLPSGNILVSDRSTGLYIVRPGGATFETYGQGCVGSAMAPCPELNPNGGTVAGDLR
ncbi:MAG TPA: choice-of-anchor B family protein, partial [Planctomycetes bacterium]|nr:choice-of-anchor B family protein [Planctomycetota bacterium]